MLTKHPLKDAIIIFGGFCTGEIVSNQGLIFTNHHCGYDVIASASSVEKNYLKDGFYARTTRQKKFLPGLYAEFLLRIEDVTKKSKILLKGLTGAERAQSVIAGIAAINQRLSDPSKSIITQDQSRFQRQPVSGFCLPAIQ